MRPDRVGNVPIGRPALFDLAKDALLTLHLGVQSIEICCSTPNLHNGNR